MEIIATQNSDNFLISAHKSEIKEILTCALGSKDESKINIGTKLPVFDYSKAIREAKAFKSSYEYQKIIQTHEMLGTLINNLSEIKE